MFEQEAMALIDEAHQREMKVVLDVVLNQVGPDHPWVSDPEKKDWFHHQGGITDWNDQWQLENCDLAGMPDLNQDNPEVYSYLLANTAGWVERLNVDGVRLDAVKHISKSFWERFVPDLRERTWDGLFVMGEAFNGDPGCVADYQRRGIDYLFDLPFYYTMRECLAEGQPMGRLGDRLAADAAYPDPHHLVTVLDNHDLPRFASSCIDNSKERLKTALALQMTMRGIPSIYYGTEAALEGGDDPHNRPMMEFGREPELEQWLQRLTSIRHEHSVVRHGDQTEIWRDDNVYAFARHDDQNELLTLVHNGTVTADRSIPLREGSPLQEGDHLVDLLSEDRFQVRDGRISVSLEPLTARVLVKTSPGT